MRLKPERLLDALRACPSLVDARGVESDEYRDLCACVAIARTCGAFDEKQVTNSPPRAVVCADWQLDEYCITGDAIADIDAGVDDVFDSFDK